MSDEKTGQEAIAVLEKFFDIAKPGGDNIAIIRDDIRRYKESIIWMGCAVIAVRLKKLYLQTRSTFMYNEDYGNKQIVAEGMILINYLYDVIADFGERGISTLVKMLFGTDEDVATLAAYFLASNQFIRPSSLQHLRTVFQTAYGTGYKVALAFALYKHGEKSYFNKSLIVQYLLPKQGYEEIEFLLKSTGRYTNKGIDEIILEEMAHPGGTGALPERITSNLQGVLGNIVMDIATDGEIFLPESGWKRKQYN